MYVHYLLRALPLKHHSYVYKLSLRVMLLHLTNTKKTYYVCYDAILSVISIALREFFMVHHSVPKAHLYRVSTLQSRMLINISLLRSFHHNIIYRDIML